MVTTATAALRESAVNAVVAAVASGGGGDAEGAGGGGDPSAVGEDLAVRVAVRARPLVAKERLERARECLSYPVDGKSVILGKNRLFQFDEVFDPTVEQSTIYADLVAPLVESCFNGEDFEENKKKVLLNNHRSSERYNVTRKIQRDPTDAK